MIAQSVLGSNLVKLPRFSWVFFISLSWKLNDVWDMEADTFHIFGATVWKYVAMSPRLNNIAWLQSKIPVWLFGNTRTSEVRKACQWNTSDRKKEKENPDPHISYYSTGQVHFNKCKLLKYAISSKTQAPQSIMSHFAPCFSPSSFHST